MSRDKASPTAKDAIEALLLILQQHASLPSSPSPISSSSPSPFSSSSPPPRFHVTPELLRLGKHDVPEAFLPLLQFLDDFLRAFFKQPSFRAPSSPPSSSSTSSALFCDVVTHLALLGYPGFDELLVAVSDEVADHGDDEAPDVNGSSRELTIVFGWLLAQFQIPTRLFPFRRHAETSPGTRSSDDVINNNHHDGDFHSRWSESLTRMEGRADTDNQRLLPEQQQQLKRLQWEMGKLNLTWRKWLQTREKKIAYEEKISRLTESASRGLGAGNGRDSESSVTNNSRVNSATNHHTAAAVASANPTSASVSSSMSPLSAYEALILSNPREYREASASLDDHLRYLKAWMLWKNGGGSIIFWKWMESVVEAKEKDHVKEGKTKNSKMSPQTAEHSSFESGNFTTLSSQHAAKVKSDLTHVMKNIHFTLETGEERIQEILCDDDNETGDDRNVSEDKLFELLSHRASVALDGQRLSKNQFPQSALGCDSMLLSDDSWLFLQDRLAALREERDALLKKKTELMAEFDAIELLEDCVILPSLSTKTYR